MANFYDDDDLAVCGLIRADMCLQCMFFEDGYCHLLREVIVEPENVVDDET